MGAVVASRSASVRRACMTTFSFSFLFSFFFGQSFRGCFYLVVKNNSTWPAMNGAQKHLAQILPWRWMEQMRVINPHLLFYPHRVLLQKRCRQAQRRPPRLL